MSLSIHDEKGGLVMSLKENLRNVYFQSQQAAFERLQKEMITDFFKVAAQGVTRFSYPLGEIPMALVQLVELWLAEEGIDVTRVTQNADHTIEICLLILPEKIIETTQYKGFGV